jgi:hypothetical protein
VNAHRPASLRPLRLCPRRPGLLPTIGRRSQVRLDNYGCAVTSVCAVKPEKRNVRNSCAVTSVCAVKPQKRNVRNGSFSPDPSCFASLRFASTWTGQLHSLDPLGTRWSRRKRVTEVLGLTDNLLIVKFHDTHRIGWLAIVSEDEFGHPEIGSTDNSPH